MSGIDHEFNLEHGTALAGFGPASKDRSPSAMSSGYVSQVNGTESEQTSR
jgi:hypothetical protein